MKKPILTLVALFGVAVSPVMAAPVSVQVQTDRSKLLKSERSCVLQIQLKGGAAPSNQKRLPLNVALVLDQSSSMRGVKLERAKQAAIAAIDQLDAEDIVSVIAYDREVRVLVPPQKVRDPEAIKRSIDGLTAQGTTALYGGVQEGATQLRKNPGSKRLHRIVLLSDGRANVGPSSPAELANLGSDLREEEIAVTTIGLGDDYNEDLMTRLAEASQANYYYVQDPETLPRIFEEELRTAKSIVARKVKIRITLPEGVKAVEVIGQPELKFDGNELEIDIADIYSKQQRRFLIACEAPEGTSSIVLANVAVEADDLTGQTVHLQATASVDRTGDRAESEKSVNKDVAADLAITQNRLAKEEAVAMADKGDARGAASILRRQVELNAVAAPQLPAQAAAALGADSDGLATMAGRLEMNQSLDKAARKRMQYENYQDKMNKR